MSMILSPDAGNNARATAKRPEPDFARTPLDGQF